MHCQKLLITLHSQHGERSSVGRAPDCGSGCRGFESHRSPSKKRGRLESQPLFFLPSATSWQDGASTILRIPNPCRLAPAVPRDNFAPTVRLKFYRGKDSPKPFLSLCASRKFAVYPQSLKRQLPGARGKVSPIPFLSLCSDLRASFIQE